MITKDTIKAQIYAFQKHAHQMYEDDVPYTVHLVLANMFCLKYIHLIPEDKRDIVIISIWIHDVREDLGISYNAIKNLFDVDVAEIVYNLTNNDGRTRKEKAINTYGPKISTNRFSVFGKLSDRLANVRYGLLHEANSMLETQAKEFDYMVEILYVPGEFDEMWNELATMLNKPNPSMQENNYIFHGLKYYSQSCNKIVL